MYTDYSYTFNAGLQWYVGPLIIDTDYEMANNMPNSLMIMQTYHSMPFRIMYNGKNSTICEIHL